MYTHVNSNMHERNNKGQNLCSCLSKVKISVLLQNIVIVD